MCNANVPFVPWRELYPCYNVRMKAMAVQCKLWLCDDYEGFDSWRLL